MRTLSLAVAVGLLVIAPRTPLESVPPACQLLTAQEVSKMMGVAETVNANDAARADFNCRYNPSPTSFDGVEITWRLMSDAPSAHTYFAKWVIPFPPMPASMTLTPVSGIGDEASITHSSVANGIFFRKGAVLVKMGTRPGASDSALKTAGAIMAGRV